MVSKPAAGVGAQLPTALATLLLGWWGIPFGPVFTIRALYRNLAGGDEVTVADLLNQLAR
jgi:hypothetical protein